MHVLVRARQVPRACTHFQAFPRSFQPTRGALVQTVPRRLYSENAEFEPFFESGQEAPSCTFTKPFHSVALFPVLQPSFKEEPNVGHLQTQHRSKSWQCLPIPLRCDEERCLCSCSQTKGFFTVSDLIDRKGAKLPPGVSGSQFDWEKKVVAKLSIYESGQFVHEFLNPTEKGFDIIHR